MAKDGHAPRIFVKKNRNGVPIYAVGLTLALSLLAFCELSKSSSVVITYVTSLVGSAQLVNWILMSFTWIVWNRGMKANGMSRDTLPAKTWIAPYCAWFALISASLVSLMQGY